MANSFEELIKNRKKAREQAMKKVEDLSKGFGNNEKDERFWDLAHLRNEDGNGRATIRLLPAPMGEKDEFILYYSYFEQSPYNNKWYVHSVPSARDSELDPAFKYNGGIYSDKSLSDDQKKKLAMRRQKKYVCNILVIDDPVQPENNGKVFLFEMGPMIFKLIEKRMKPDPTVDEFEAANPFDPVEGCNLKIKIVSKKLNGRLVPNYEQSTWADVSPIDEDMEKIEKIWKSEYPLKEFADEENTKLFKSVEKMKKDLAAWLGEETEEESKPAREMKQEKSSTSKIDASSFNEEEDEDSSEDEAPFDVDDEPTKTSVLDSDDDDDDDWINKFK